jgi:hypothetical protein
MIYMHIVSGEHFMLRHDHVREATGQGEVIVKFRFLEAHFCPNIEIRQSLILLIGKRSLSIALLAAAFSLRHF